MNNTRRGDTLVAILTIIAILIIITSLRSCTVVHAGQVGVQVSFGTVTNDSIDPGIAIHPPWASIYKYSTQQQQYTADDVATTSQDSLTSTVDITVIWRLDGKKAPQLYKEVGDLQRFEEVLLQTKLRSAIREATRGVERAEQYATQATQTQIQDYISKELNTLSPHGMIIDDVLMRDLKLPAVLQEAVVSKVKREQMALMQQSELQRYTTEQQSKVAAAHAETEAAEQVAARVHIEADAEAYKIKVINEAAASNPVYVKLMALKTMEAIAASPSSKLFFIDSNSPTPVPLLHIADDLKSTGVGVLPAKAAAGGVER
jgi:regulator of protease activity HflC (stomatin/prohibitin superfamily)